MNPVTRIVFSWLAAVGLLVSTAAFAEQKTAHEVVRSATEAVMEVVEEAQNAQGADTEGYYDKVQELLDPVVDFRGFARGVMGPYASSSRYRSLDEAGREELVSQLDRFTETMRSGLVRTYSKGLLAFGGSRIEVKEPDAADDNSRRASVQQLIYKDGSEPYVVLYQMGKDREGQWKLRNMIIENVNLGEIYRSQFESAARKYDGDLDKVIESWSTVELEG